MHGFASAVRAAPSAADRASCFLCQNLRGYRNLTQLVTRSFLEGQQRGVPMLERDWLRAGQSARA